MLQLDVNRIFLKTHQRLCSSAAVPIWSPFLKETFVQTFSCFNNSAWLKKKHLCSNIYCPRRWRFSDSRWTYTRQIISRYHTAVHSAAHQCGSKCLIFIHLPTAGFLLCLCISLILSITSPESAMWNHFIPIWNLRIEAPHLTSLYTLL